MSQIIAIDYGKARCGIAATDDLQIIASALTTVETKNLTDFLQKYFVENISTIKIFIILFKYKFNINFTLFCCFTLLFLKK